MWKATGPKMLENRQKMPKSRTENAREQAKKCSSFSRKNSEFLGYSNFQGSILKVL
ncbi:hypothetical protein [Methanosarcina barkeri]|uniref:hypothetical protein n=1 Tax=Methanosarcina barkeri TaxID=2208 RepID=UPI000AADC68B|nr:hypothetical protein [Methanosarcina barkeri]